MMTNLLFNRLTAIGKRLAMVLTMLLIVGIGQAWGETATYTLNSSNNGGSVTTGNVSWSIASGAITAQNSNCKLTGTITVTLPAGATLNKVSIAKSNTWGSGATVTFKTGSTTLNTFSNSGDYTLTTNKDKLTYTFSKSGTSSKNAWVKSITVDYTVAAATTFTVTYNANGGSGTMSNSTGSSIKIKECTFTAPECKQFTSWNTAANGSGTSYAPNATVTTNLTLYAQWGDLPSYTVKLMDNNEVLTSSCNTPIALPSRVGCDGYEFVGWTKSWSVAQTTWTTTAPAIIPAGSYAPTANENLYPVYTKTEGGGSEPTAYSAGDEGDFVIASYNTSNSKWYAIPETPTLSSSKITGVEITVSQTAGGVNYVSTANAEGYTWKIANATNGQTISDGSNYIYHSNGGSSGTNLAYGTSTSYTWKIEKETNGLTFKGMNGSATNSRGLLFNGSVFGGYALSNEDQSGYYRIQVLPIAGSSTTYYISTPQCNTETSYSVTYKGNGNTSGSVPTDDTKYANDAQVIVLGNTGNLAKTGHTFSGWNTQSDGSGINYAAGATFTITKNTTLYAQWKANTYKVSFNANEGTGSMNDQDFTYDEAKKALSENTFTRTGYTFNGWNTQADGQGTTYTDQQSVNNLTTTNGETVTLYAQWTPITYEITYTNLKGATNGNQETYTIEDAITFSDPTNLPKGYDFIGWNPASITVGTTGDKTVEAQWTPTTYTINYENLGGASNTNPTQYTIESETITFEEPGDRAGYIFKGWEPATIEKGSTGPVTVTAKWCEILGDATGLSVQTDYVENGLTYVKFSWTPADNTKSHASKQVICIGKVGEEKKCTDLEKNKVWTGDLRSKLSPGEYEWTIQAIGDGTDYCDSQVITGENFTIIGYVISFDTDGGDGEYNDVTIFGGETYTIPVAPTKTGYTFKGWSDGINLYQPGAEISDLTGDLTLTAIWLTTTTLSWSDPTCTATIASPSNVFPSLTATPEEIKSGVVYESSNTDVATIDANGNIRLLTAGKTTITANFVENATHAASSAEYTLTVVASDNCKWVETDINDIDPYDEVVVTMGNNTTVYALHNSEKLTNSPKALEVTVQDEALVGTDFANYGWHVTNIDGGYQLQSCSDASKYLYGVASYITISSNPTTFSIFTSPENGNKGFMYTIEYKPYYLGHGAEDGQTAWKRFESSNTLKSNTLKFYKKTCLPENEYWITYNLENVTCTNDPKIETIISTSEDFELTFEAADGYILTDDIEVQMVGGTLTTTWDKDNGVLTINKPDGGFTGNITISLAACLSLPAPQNLAETDLTSSSVTLTWDAVTNAQSYEVFVTDFGTQDITRSDLTECQVTISGLTKNTEFAWDVKAVAEGYCGIPSELGYFQTLQTYTVTFDKNGHENAEYMPATQTVDDGSLAQEPADDPSDNGYSFGGWYDNKNCEGDPFNFSETLITDNTVLYAKWNIVTYKIAYEGLEDATNHANNPATYTIETPTITFLAPSTRSGYIFSGWNPTTLEKGSYGNKTITATWEKGKIVTWKADGNVIEQQTYASGDALVLPTEEIEACQGSEFVGWTDDENYYHDTDAPTYVTAGSAVTTDATYYAVYAEVPEGEPIEEITKSYTFSRYTAGSQYATNEEHILDEDVTIYTTQCHFTTELRIYASNTHNGYVESNKLPGNIISIGFNAGDNSDYLLVYGSTDGNDWQRVGRIATKSAYADYSLSFGETNYTYFKLDVEGSNQIRITSMTITYMSGSGEPSAAYANYSTTCSATYRVSYDFAEGEGICTTESVKVGNDYTICANIPTKTGYDFVGWSTADDNEAEFLKADVEAGQAIIENVSNNVELYAVWEAKTYEITWWSNGVEYTTTSHTFDTELQLPADPYTCYGAKTFIGWTEAASVNVDGSDITYINENTNPSENKTYYAVFADVTNNGSGGYDKVTEALDDYSGEYLIVYEAGKKAFNGGLSTLDVTSNGIAVTINNNNTIESNQTTDAAKFTIAAINDGYSIKSASGYYITGKSTNDNGLLTSTTQSDGTTISFTNGDLDIVSNSKYLRYNVANSDNRFRYFKSNTNVDQKAVALYKKSAGATLTNYTTTPTGCAEMDVAENAYVTSANGQSVKVNVPIAVNFQDGYTIDATLNDGTKFEVVSVSEITDNKATVTLAYTPDYSNNTETAEVKLTAKYGENFVTAKSFTVNGRSLPERFVIATKVGATWYALPANMNGATNPEGVVIDVDETTMTATAPNTTVYTLFPVATINGNSDRYKEYGERLRFAAVNNGNRGLWANDAKSGTTINNDAAITAANSTAGAAYEWKITTTIVDGNWQYTLQTDQLNNQKYLRYWTAASGGAKWGTYASGNDKLNFLPVTETKPFDYKVVEWYPTKVLIQTDAAITNPIVKIGGILVDHVTCTNKGGKLYEISGLSLAENPTKVLTLSYTADEVTYTNSKGVPIILSRETKSISGEPFVALTKEVYNYADLVVRDGATLTMDGTQEANTLWDVTIYPTSKISVPESKKLTVHSLTLFGGIDEIYNGSTYTLNKYGVPELSLKGTLKKSISTIDYLMRVDSKQMYSLTVPYDVQLADIKYWDGTNIVLGDELWVSAYDGASRAQNQGNGKNWIYETDFESKLGAATLKAGVGYTISAELQNGVGSEYSILRMPMTSNVENDATEAAKTVAVTAWGKDANVTDNHKGWNLVGNPYMTTITGADDDNLVLGYLKETGTGPWEWMEKNYRYVTIPSDNGEWYYQQKFTEAVLPPFKNFFVQIGTTGELAFGLSTRQNAPSRYLQQEQAPREVEFELLLSNEAQSDNMGLLISEDYTPAYEINADLEKMLGTMSVYSIYNGYQLAYTALSPLNAMEEIPLGYVVPATGEYTFALDEHGDLDDIEHIYLLDYDKNTTTDLMEDIYTFAATEKKSDKRFAISVVLKAEEEVETPTQLETLEWESDRPCKFIFHDQMYILRNGVIYDAMGKQVQTINK